MGGLLAELDLIMGEDYDLLGELGFGFASGFEVGFASNCCSLELCCFILAEFGSCKWFLLTMVALLSTDFFELFKKEKRVGLLMFWVPVLPASRVVFEVLSSPIFSLFGDP